MNDRGTTMKRLQHRNGLFGKHHVMGFEFQTDAGRHGWHIMTWVSPEPGVRDYWVENGEFHGIGVHLCVPGTNENRYVIYDVVDVAVPREREAVLEAIKSWTKSSDETEGV